MPRASREATITKEGIGRRLQLIRKSRGLTQAKLARMLRTLQSNISDIERGARKPSLQQLASLSRVLHVSIDEILGEEKTRGGGLAIDPRFVQRLQKIDQLSKRQKQTLLSTIDTFLKGAGITS